MARKRKRAGVSLRDRASREAQCKQGELFGGDGSGVGDESMGRDEGKGSEAMVGPAFPHTDQQAWETSYVLQGTRLSRDETDDEGNHPMSSAIPWALPEQSELPPAVSWAQSDGEDDNEEEDENEEKEEDTERKMGHREIDGVALVQILARDGRRSSDSERRKEVDGTPGRQPGDDVMQEGPNSLQSQKARGMSPAGAERDIPIGESEDRGGGRGRGRVRKREDVGQGDMRDGHASFDTRWPLPGTVFVFQSGKAVRVGRTAALVVGLSYGEQLCFVGAARVRAGRGQASISGHTLLPIPFGVYVDTHSPTWRSLLVVRPVKEEDPDWVPGKVLGDIMGLGCPSVGGQAARAQDPEEVEVEAAVDSMSEDFPVVVVFRPLDAESLSFLTAQKDADALYQPYTRSKPCKDSPLEESQGVAMTANASLHPVHEGSSPLEVAQLLRLPGFQVVVDGVEGPGINAAGFIPLCISPTWAEAVESVVADSLSLSPGGDSSGSSARSVLVCGAKGVGKSTLSRHLVNRLLSRHPHVAYIDCDLGQPEFTPPGVVSLHLLEGPILGPPHTGLRRPDLSFFLGATTSKPDPLLFSAAVRALVERVDALRRCGWQQQALEWGGEGAREGLEVLKGAKCNNATAVAGGLEAAPGLAPALTEFSGLPGGEGTRAGSGAPVPLVINTDGWVKGMGADLLGAVVDAARPGHIIQLLGPTASKSFNLEGWPTGCRVHPVGAVEAPPPQRPRVGVGAGSGAPPPPTRLSAQDQRSLRLLAYFLGGGFGAIAGAAQGQCTRAGKRISDPRLGDLLQGGLVSDPAQAIPQVLNSTVPRAVPWSSVKVRVMNSAVPDNLVLHAINGAVVGLVADLAATPAAAPTAACQGDDGGRQEAGVRPRLDGGLGPGLGCPGPVVLSETPLAPCVGLGLVRAVDPWRRLLYVVTPEPLEALRRVTVLVKGSLQLPPEMMYESGRCVHPYFSAEVVGGKSMKGQGHLLRRGKQ